MKLNKKYLPSLGFVILLTTVVFSGLFVNWVLGPLSYEKAAQEEQIGLKLLQKDKPTEALKHFLTAANIKDNNISTARRYAYAGDVVLSDEKKASYYNLALRYNPKDERAKTGRNELFAEIRYKNRYADGWSIGKSSQVILNVPEEGATYDLLYFTSGISGSTYRVNILIDKKLYKKQNIKSKKPYAVHIVLPSGRHTIELFIDKTFNPKKLGMGEDARNLGLHFEIKKEEKNSE